MFLFNKIKKVKVKVKVKRKPEDDPSLSTLGFKTENNFFFLYFKSQKIEC